MQVKLGYLRFDCVSDTSGTNSFLANYGQNPSFDFFIERWNCGHIERFYRANAQRAMLYKLRPFRDRHERHTERKAFPRFSRPESDDEVKIISGLACHLFNRFAK